MVIGTGKMIFYENSVRLYGTKLPKNI